MEFKKGDWIVKIRWYELCPLKTNMRGDRFYRRGDSQWIGCASIVRTIKPKDVVMTWSGQHYRLSKEAGKHIEDYGDLLCQPNQQCFQLGFIAYSASAVM